MKKNFFGKFARFASHAPWRSLPFLNASKRIDRFEECQTPSRMRWCFVIVNARLSE